MIDATVRYRSARTSRSPRIIDILNDDSGNAARRLRSIAGAATKEAKRLMEAELEYPRRPSDRPPGGKERRRRDIHLIDSIRSSVVTKSPTGPRIKIQAHPAFIFLERPTRPHNIPSPAHPEATPPGFDGVRGGWSVRWAPPVWHTEGGEHAGPNGEWINRVPHPGTQGHYFLRRAVRHALNAS